MKFLLISQTGANLGLANRINHEGHHTTLTADSSIGVGFGNHVPLNGNLLRTVYECSPDIVVFDRPSDGKIAEAVKSKGFKTVFSSSWSQLLESSEEYNQQVINSLGLQVNPGVDGHKLIVEGWFNGSKFIASLLSIVYNRMMNGNVGPHVGCMGSVIWGKFKDGKLYDQTLGKIEKALRKVDYRGPVSLDITITDTDLFVGKIYAFPRDITTYSLFEGTKKSVSDVLFSLATGERLDRVYVDDYVVNIAITVPPWPYTASFPKQPPIKLNGVNSANLKHLWLKDAIKTEDGYVSNRVTGHLGYVTARGKSFVYSNRVGKSCFCHGIDEAKRRAYSTINNLDIDDLQYRTDIGTGAKKIFQELNDLGWIHYSDSPATI